MKLLVALVGGLATLGVAAPPLTHGLETCGERLAAKLLYAITSQDAHALEKLGNNPAVFDAQAIEYLTSASGNPFPGGNDLQSAYAILRGQRVLTKVTVSELQDGTKTIDIVYLPTSTAAHFAGLSKKVREKQAFPFRDYVMCSLVVKNGSVTMPHACYAETDALD